MNQSNQPSFIPKNPTTQPGQRVRRKAPMSLSMLLSSIIFIIALAATGSMFAYIYYLEQSIEEKRDALVAAQQSFNLELIENITTLDTRIETAGELLEGHLSFSQFFEELEAHTLANVQFETFEYERTEGGDITVSMSGRARSFNTIARQSEEFEQESFLQRHAFSNFNLDERGNVEFNLEAEVVPSVILYAQLPRFTSGSFGEEAAAENVGADEGLRDTEATSTATSTPEDGAQSSEESSAPGGS